MMLATATVRRTPNRRAAFTLLEVLVVVAILVILAGVGVVATTRYLEDARKAKAQMGCQGIAQACEAYKLNPASDGEYPANLELLLQPMPGSNGPPLLKNGDADLTDPWNNRYQYSVQASPFDPSGTTQIPLVETRAPDNTPITQFGIGQKSGR